MLWWILVLILVGDFSVLEFCFLGSFDYVEKSLITMVSVHKISTGSSAENFFLF